MLYLVYLPKMERTTPSPNPPAYPDITFVTCPESALPSYAKSAATPCRTQPARFARARAAMRNATMPTMQFMNDDVPARKL